MGKEWDAPHKAWDKRERDEQRESSGRRRGGYIGLPERAPSQFQAGLNYQLWTQSWATEALRVLKPGGSLLSFGGTRTFHRLTCGLEDAGFVVKDCLMWLYGQGFPKSQDAGKMIDKRAGVEVPEGGSIRVAGEYGGRNLQPPRRTEVANGQYQMPEPATPLARHWDGYKIGGIKPAWEPIVWAVKPPEGAWIDNVLKYGVGAVNVDECRVGTDDLAGRVYRNKERKDDNIYGGGNGIPQVELEGNPKGRFPANLLLSHAAGCREIGTKRVKSNSPSVPERSNLKMFVQDGKGRSGEHSEGYADPDGLETVEAWECVEGGTVEAEVIELDGELFTPFDPLPDLRRAGSLLIEQLRQVRDNRNIRIGDIDNSLCYETHAPLLSKLPSYRVCCRSCRHLYDELSLLIQGFAQESPRQLSDALELVDRHLDSQEHNQKNLSRVHPSSSDDSPGDVLDLDIELNNIFDAHPCVLCEPKIPFHKSDTVSSESHETNCNTPENNKTDSSDRHKRLSDNACTDALSRLVFVLACKTSSLYIPIISHSSDIKLETCPVRLLDEQSGVSSSPQTVTRGGGRTAASDWRMRDMTAECYGDTGGASRFFYTSKATNRDSYNDHPTLKPTDLVEWLVRLVTRPGQTVLDPFAGSGTTGVAAIQSGREFILIEQDEHYISICERRTTDGAQQGMF